MKKLILYCIREGTFYLVLNSPSVIIAKCAKLKLGRIKPVLQLFHNSCYITGTMPMSSLSRRYSPLSKEGTVLGSRLTPVSDDTETGPVSYR